MACEQQHINNLSLNNDGWIIVAGNNDNVELTPSCLRLVEEVKLDLATIEQDEEIFDASEQLEELHHSRDLHKYILLVIADIVSRY